jgi:hypothetical protein
MNRDIDALLAPFRALGARENVPIADAGERLIWGIQCQKTGVTDSHIPLLQDMPELRALGLSDTSVTNAALPILTKLPHLESLDLDGTIIDDGGIESLANLPSLEFLHVSRTKLTESGIRELQKRLPHCEIVSDYDD